MNTDIALLGLIALQTTYLTLRSVVNRPIRSTRDKIICDTSALIDGRLVTIQLLIVAKKLQAKLCTTDYNLNKVARTEQITVVNVNELAHALRPMHLPGEQIQVMIVAPGQNKDQGVGYLDDGSMVVVDGGRDAMNTVVEVETIRVLQTEAGRMVFAKLRTSKPVQKKKYNSPKHSKPQKSNEDTMVKLANK